MKNFRVCLAGHEGMVGSAILRQLYAEEYQHIITASFRDLDLREQEATRRFFEAQKPEIVILVAAKVGGIKANMAHPAQFLYDNLMIEANVYESARLCGAKKVVFLGSSCIYPRECPQPMKEEYLLTGPLEPTNEGYALAKIAGIKLAEYYEKEYGLPSVCLMPCNLYGQNDSFDLEHSHVLSALIRRFSEARERGDTEITLWGTGTARREFMNVDDCAAAVTYFLDRAPSSAIINVGWGEDLSIKELAEMIATRVGFTGTIHWDHTKPDGMPRKCMEVTKMRALGFAPKITLEAGIERMVGEYSNYKKGGRS